MSREADYEILGQDHCTTAPYWLLAEVYKEITVRERRVNARSCESEIREFDAR